MGESGGRAGEPTEPHGVGGIKAIAGRISFGVFKSEADDPVAFGPVDQLAPRSRVFAGWKPHFSWSSFDLFKVEFVLLVNLMIV